MNDFGPGTPGTSASEIPPMVDPARLRPSVGPVGSAGTAPHPGDSNRVSDPIPFRRPMPEATPFDPQRSTERREELTVAEPAPAGSTADPVLDLAVGTPAPWAEGREMSTC